MLPEPVARFSPFPGRRMAWRHPWRRLRTRGRGTQCTVHCVSLPSPFLCKKPGTAPRLQGTGVSQTLPEAGLHPQPQQTLLQMCEVVENLFPGCLLCGAQVHQAGSPLDSNEPPTAEIAQNSQSVGLMEAGTCFPGFK